MATTPVAASTPSPPAHIHTPPTPRLGFADSWEPFSPRKSSRLANAKSTASSSSASARTPSPSAATRRAVRQLRSPRQTKQTMPHPPSFSQHLDVASLSPAPTPRKKKTMSTAHFLSPEDASKASKKSAAGTASTSAGESSHTRMGMGALPTPAKTPSKKYHAASQNESNIAAIARNLFHTDVDEVMSSPSKTPSRKPKKYTGISLESFAVVEDEEPISIFTDSQDRVPEADSSVENPFFGNGAATASTSTPEPSRRRSKRNHVSIPGEGKQTVEDATRREDGLVYVFRGKKVFRKFEDSYASQEEDILNGVGSNKRLTRSAIKPRLLFPRDEGSGPETTPDYQNGDANGGTTEDEEAVTDIEDHNLDESDGEAEAADEPFGTPADLINGSAPNTPPNVPKFAPATPPVTGRTTRSGQKSAEEATPVKASAPKKRSPFDGWRQTKSGASTAGHKRPVDELDSAVPTTAAKRARS